MIILHIWHTCTYKQARTRMHVAHTSLSSFAFIRIVLVGLFSSFLCIQIYSWYSICFQDTLRLGWVYYSYMPYSKASLHTI